MTAAALHAVRPPHPPDHGHYAAAPSSADAPAPPPPPPPSAGPPHLPPNPSPVRSHAHAHAHAHAHTHSHTHTHSSGPSVSINALAANASPITVVTYRNTSIKALIDPTLSVADVVRHLCVNTMLGVQEPHQRFALRDEQGDQLVTDANMRRKIEAGRRFKLCSSPAIEAAEMVDKLHNFRTEDRVLKIATYTLQHLIREAPFAAEFVARGGLRELVALVMSFPLPPAASSPPRPQRGPAIGVNTLAYALVSLQNLMECFDDGWEEIDGAFVQKVVQILTRLDRINVCRPLTAILKKLVVSGPDDAAEDEEQEASSGERTPTGSRPGSGIFGIEAPGFSVLPGRSIYGPEARATGINKFGFDIIYLHIAEEPDFLRTLVHRLASADTTLCLYSFSLLNTLVRHATSSFFEQLTTELDALDFVNAAVRLMNTNPSDELTICLLEAQANQRRILNWRMHTPVAPQNKRHVSALSFIWLQARIQEIAADDGGGRELGAGTSGRPSTRFATAAALNSRYKWRRLGFGSEAVAKEFGKLGWLALRNCEAFVRPDSEGYSKIIIDQLQQPVERRWPFGRASIEVTDILAEFWNVANPAGVPYAFPGATATTAFQPYLLHFERVHGLVLRFFLRMWTESNASAGDFARLAALVRSQVRATFVDEGHKTWADVERSFLETEYASARGVHLKALEQTDETASKPSIRSLRDQLYRESYEFVRQQRIRCLFEGAWFLNKSPSASQSIGAGAAMWRFYRLSPDKRYLHYCESNERTPVPAGLSALPERIDLSQVTDISVSNMAQQIRSHFDPSPSAAPGMGAGGTAAPQKQSAPEAAANLTFGLIKTPDTLVAELRALNQSQFSEWVDGLSMMRGEGGVIRTRNTADYIQALTEVAVQCQLLDITGDKIDLPSLVSVPAPPDTWDFYYAGPL